jgi:hypothetical protein
MDNYRRFKTEPDPFDRVWDVEFRWQQNGITIRHADTVDVKFNIWTVDEPAQERVVAINHPDLLKLSGETGMPLTDALCLKLGALHLKHMIETDEDMEKTLVTVPYAELRRYAEMVNNVAAVGRD